MRLVSASRQGNEYLYTCYCSHCYNQLTLCVCPVKDDRYEKEKRKTKHEMYIVALKQLYTVKTSNVQEGGVKGRAIHDCGL